MENKKGISGSTLKMIAIVTMVIDHIGAAVLARLLMVNGLGELDQTNADAIMLVAFSKWSTVLDVHGHANDRTCGVPNLLLLAGGGIFAYT